ncbi:MAG: PleD family two-component system response regulator [Rickettsiaceae bacterium]
MTANILLVDDLESNIKLLETKLLSEYYNVFTSTSGHNALEILEHHKIDIVLLDVMMPGMDGFTTCIKIKSNPKTLHIPVIMVTALSDIEDRVRGLEAGADDFLTKPINDIALFARVKSLSRIKAMIDELELRNQTNSMLGASTVDIKDNFVDSNILLVNDDIIQAKNVKLILSKISNKIKIAHSYDQINSVIENFVPDIIIISDQLDDEEDPLRLNVMFKSKKILQYAVIMLLVEEDNVNMVIKGMEIGVNDYCVYPLEASELIARVKTQLRRKLYQDDIRSTLDRSVSLSIKDGLTEVFNRRYFDIHIAQRMNIALETHKPLALLMLDIDDFKKINDTYGHQVGDRLLRHLIKIIKPAIRITDLVARYGGEEFAILLNNVQNTDALNIAHKIRKKVANTTLFLDKKNSKKKIRQTISIGITSYRKDDTVNSFIQRADKALYQAKNQGKNKVIQIQKDNIVN